jgi:hypothetical protein
MNTAQWTGALDLFGIVLNLSTECAVLVSAWDVPRGSLLRVSRRRRFA